MRLEHLFKWIHIHRIPFAVFTLLHAFLLPSYVCKCSCFLAIGLVLLHVFFVYAHLKQKICLVFISCLLLLEMAFWQTHAIVLGLYGEYPIFFFFGKIEAELAGKVFEATGKPGYYALKMIFLDYIATLLTLMLFTRQFYILDTQTGSITITPSQKSKSLNIVCTWSNNSSPDIDGYFENVYGMEEKKVPAKGYTFQV